jgi:hypothetical protein
VSERKVWEEEWTRKGRMVDTGPTDCTAVFTTETQARLAAQSPKMARLLLKFRSYGWRGKAGRAEVDEVLRDAGVRNE